VELAVTDYSAGGGIILTASHNPVQWNALKLLNEKGEFISGEDGKKLLNIAETEDFNFSAIEDLGGVSFIDDYLDIHIKKILELDLVDRDLIASRKFKVVVDAVNSSGGLAIPKLLSALGVEEVKKLYCEPNGNFPHNPEPLPEHLGEISSILRGGNYDLGVVVDPDVDRLALVCENGEFFGEEYTLVSVADYILSIEAGNTVSNLSSTQALSKITSRWGGTYHAAAVGEVNVVSKMKEVGAVIGGEGNGGIIYPALHYGRDALVGVALFLTSLARSEKKVSELRAGLPDFYISKNKIELTPDIDVDLILHKIKDLYSSQEISTIDGIRIDFIKESEWVHLRCRV
jgi:phosphomannomutase